MLGCVSPLESSAILEVGDWPRPAPKDCDAIKTEVVVQMSVPLQQALFAGDEATIASAMALLIHYYDLAPASSRMLLNKWLQRCPADWVRAAVIEALYQGRYRAVSVEQILAFWIRRGKLTSHFNREFEAIIAVPIQQELMPQGQAAAMATRPRPKLPLQPTGLRVTSAPDGNRIQPDIQPKPTALRVRSPQMHQPPIDQFTPADDSSGFWLRLQEVAEQFEAPQALPNALPMGQEQPLLDFGQAESLTSVPLEETETETPPGASQEETDSENIPSEDSVSE